MNPPPLPLPGPDLTPDERTLLQLLAAAASERTISTTTGRPLNSIAGAVTALLDKTSCHTRTQAAAWATAQRIVTSTTQPCAAQTTLPHLPPRMLRILRAWAGGTSPEEVRAELGVAVGTMRGYSARVLNALGVHRQEQAAVAGVLCGLVEPAHITPAWAELPAETPVSAAA
ncbi:hypothetical protein Kpho02_70160 [Kitasatospora phosalacinea]|uniref:HTH luxR-type domain-containing protein n=1 Tax=Kitasatospora phosalacinea TaxID=2065 RepID=A0A9W6V3S9_9ACTN|nr:hypothetical protein [Kitasatospora phosalacinea]GLW74719.1 hypothetical protein Kpho02_70160 [Kitasatospora phosalacinea]